MAEFHKTKNLKRIQIMVQSLQFLKGRSYNVKALLQNLEIIIIAINSLLQQMAEVLATPSQVELVLPVAANFPANFQNRRPAKEIRGRCPVAAPVLAETETETASIESRFQN